MNWIHFHVYQPLEYFDRGIFVFMVQNYNLKKHFKGHKRHTKSEDLLYNVSNTVFLCFWVFYNIQPDKSLWFESSRHYWITPICCCSLPPAIWSYQILLSLLSVFWRTEQLWHKITSKLDLERACSCSYLLPAGKSFWSAFSYYLSNDLEIFQALRFQQPLFFQCSEMSLLMCLNFSSSLPIWSGDQSISVILLVKSRSFLVRRIVFEYVKERRNMTVFM